MSRPVRSDLFECFHLAALSASEPHHPSLWGPLRCPLAKVEEPCGMFQRSLIGFRCFGPLASPPTNTPSCVSCVIGLNSPNTLLSPLNERGQRYKMDTGLLQKFNMFRQKWGRKIKCSVHLYYPATQQSLSSFLFSSWAENIYPHPPHAPPSLERQRAPENWEMVLGDSLPH